LAVRSPHLDPTNEAGANQGGHSGFTLKKFFVRLDPPLGGVGRSLTFRIRKNIADTGIEVVITDPDVSGNDVVHSTNLADYDLICVSVPSGFPGVSQGEWGLVSYSPSGIPTGEIQNKMVAAGLI
jgi:hypothetical protein